MINVVKNRTRLYALTTSVLFFLQGMDVYSSGWWPLPNLPFGLGGLLGGAEARGSTGEEGPGKTAEAGRQSADGQMAAQVSGSDGAQQRQQQANLRGRAQQGTEAEGTVLQSLASLSSYDCTLQDNERQHNPIYCYDGEAHKVKGSAIGVKKFGENAVYAVGNKGVKGSGHSVGHVKVPSVPIAHKATSVAMEDVNITGVTPSQPVADGGASLRGDVQGAGGKYGFGSAVFSRLGAEVTLKKTNTQDFVTGLEAENGGHIVMEGGRIEKSYIGALADNSSSISLEGVDIYLEEPDGKVPLGVNVLQSFSGSTISMKSGSIIFPLGAAGVLSENEGFVKLEEVKINVLRKVAGGGTTEVGSRGAGFGGKDISVVFVLKDGFVSSNRVTFNGSDAIVLWVGNSFVLNDTLFDVLNVYSGNVGDTDGFVETVDAAISDGTGKIGASFKSSRFKVDGKKSYGIYFSEPLLEGALVETKSSGNLLEGLGDERAATQKEAAQLEVKEKDGEVIRHAVILENSTLRVPEGVAIYGGNLKGSVVVGRGSTVSGDVLLKASSRSDLSVFVHSSTIFGPAYVDKDADARFFLSGSEWYLAKSDVQSTYSSLGWNCSYSCISHMGLVNSNVRFVSPSGNDRGYKTLHIGKGRGTVYSAEGVSKIFFNADLMPKSVDDDATQVSDRLLIHGDVSGKTLVHVNSVSNGAVLRQNESQDIPYSVSIIQVFGSAEEDSFKLEHGYITLDGLPYKYVLRAYGPTIPPKMNYFDRKLVANSRDVWDFRLENQYVIPLVSGYTTATNFQPIFKPKPRILVASSAETETGSGTGQGEVNGQSVTPSVSGESASVISVQSSPLARSEDFEESETSGQHSSNERTDVGLSNLAVSSRHGPSGLTLSLVSGVPTSDEERVGNRLVTSADMDIVLLDSMSSVSYGRGEDVEYVISGLDDASETDLSEIGTYETGVYRLESDTLDHTVTDEDGLEETVVMTAVSTLSPPSTSLLSTVSTVSKEKGSISSSPTLPARSETSSAVESPSLPNGSPAAPSVSGEEASVLLSSSPTLPARSETSSAVESPSLPNGSPAAPSVSREEASVLLSSSPTLPARSETSSAVESLSLPNRSPVTFPVSRKPVPLNSYAAIVPPLSSTKPKVSGSVDRVGSANNEDASSQCNDTEQNGVGRSQIAYSCSDGQSHTMRNLTLKASDKKQHSMHAKRQNTIIELEGATISGADFSFDDKNNVDLTQLQAVSAVLAEEGAEVVLNKKSTVQSSLIGLEAQRGGKVKMTGGAVNVHYVGALAGSGSSVDLSDTKINITGDLAVAALASNAGQITMDSGVITLTNGVAVRSESGGNVTLDRVNIIAKRGQNKPNSTETFGRAAFLLSDRGSVGFANGSVVTDANALWIRNNGDVVESGSSRTKRSSQIRSSVNHANIEYSTIRVEGDESYGIYFDGMDQRSVGAQNHAANGKPTRQTRSVKSSVVSSSEKVPVDITGVVSLKKTDFEVLKSIAIYGNNSSGRVSIEDKAHLSGDLLLRSENSSNLSVSVDNSLITGGARVDRSSHAKFDLSNGAQWLLTKSQHQLQQSANADCSDSCISSINLANSSIKFVLPTSGENQYQTLRIGKGSGTVYSASGASIHLNARLNPHDPSDQQVTDRLVIHGDVSGKTKIHVRGDAGNVGDVIANRKIAHSVSVIQVYGQAKKDSFQLDGNYVALRNSPYKYTLRAYAPEATSKQEHVQQKFMKDGGAFWNFRLENQYVKSMGSAALPEQFARSVVPQVPTYLSLPNSVFHAGLMDISNQKKQFETLRMTSTGMVEVRENPALYLRGYGGSYRYASDLSALEYGYDGDLDYRGVEAGVLLKTIENADNSISFGVMGTYGKLSLQPLNVEQSQKSAFDKWTATVYGSMQHNVGFYVDSLLSYGLFKGDVLTRARGKTATLKGNPLSVSLSGGQTIVTGYEGFVFDPQVQVVYQNLQFNKARDIDNFDIEMGRLDQWVARVGGRLIKTPTGPEGVNAVAFYGKLYLAHGFEGKQSVHFKDAFKLGAFGSSLEAGLGFNAKLLPQFSLHADVLYQHKLNKAGFSGTSFSGGVRYQF
ncbi:autotransporter outer membrane beta-barrel domain-containing protein [Bartonella sp. OC68QHHN]|uniref:autotransporter outer membrane beta-barrel domain-containing protein n=1 Tax=Bartonella sp. OC68QHHN TaxID=3243567 RepID=UPI0035CF60A5